MYLRGRPVPGLSLSDLRNPRRAYRKLVVEHFHCTLYHGMPWGQTRWMGVPLGVGALSTWPLCWR